MHAEHALYPELERAVQQAGQGVKDGLRNCIERHPFPALALVWLQICRLAVLQVQEVIEDCLVWHQDSCREGTRNTHSATPRHSSFPAKFTYAMPTPKQPLSHLGTVGLHKYRHPVTPSISEHAVHSICKCELRCNNARLLFQLDGVAGSFGLSATGWEDTFHQKPGCLHTGRNTISCYTSPHYRGLSGLTSRAAQASNDSWYSSFPPGKAHVPLPVEPSLWTRRHEGQDDKGTGKQ